MENGHDIIGGALPRNTAEVADSVVSTFYILCYFFEKPKTTSLKMKKVMADGMQEDKKRVM